MNSGLTPGHADEWAERSGRIRQELILTSIRFSGAQGAGAPVLRPELTKAPKYGNDQAGADALADRVVGHCAFFDDLPDLVKQEIISRNRQLVT